MKGLQAVVVSSFLFQVQPGARGPTDPCIQNRQGTITGTVQVTLTSGSSELFRSRPPRCMPSRI